MSIRQITKVLYQLRERVTDGEFRILMYLADRARDDGDHIYPHVTETIRHKTGFVQRTIELRLKKFIERGWLREIRQGDRLVRYQLTLSDPRQLALPDASNDEGESACENPVEKPVENSEAECTSCDPTDHFLISTIAFRDPTDQNLAASDSSGETSQTPPSFVRPSSVLKTTGAVAPGHTPHGENESESGEAGGVLPAALCDHDGDGASRPDHRPGRVEGAREGPRPCAGIPDAVQRPGVVGDRGRRDGAPGVEATTGAEVTSTGGRDRAADAAGVETTGRGVRNGEDDPRAGTPADPRLDVRAYLDNLKARLNIQNRTTTELHTRRRRSGR